MQLMTSSARGGEAVGMAPRVRLPGPVVDAIPGGLTRSCGCLSKMGRTLPDGECRERQPVCRLVGSDDGTQHKQRRAPARGPASHTDRYGSPNRSVYEPRKSLGMRGRCPGAGQDPLRGGPPGTRRTPTRCPAPGAPTVERRRPPTRHRWVLRRRTAPSTRPRVAQHRSSAPGRSRASL